MMMAILLAGCGGGIATLPEGTSPGVEQHRPSATAVAPPAAPTTDPGNSAHVTPSNAPTSRPIAPASSNNQATPQGAVVTPTSTSSEQMSATATPTGVQRAPHSTPTADSSAAAVPATTSRHPATNDQVTSPPTPQVVPIPPNVPSSAVVPSPVSATGIAPPQPPVQPTNTATPPVPPTTQPDLIAPPPVGPVVGQPTTAPPVAPPTQPDPIAIQPFGPTLGQPLDDEFAVDLGSVPIGSQSAPLRITVHWPGLDAGVQKISVGPGFAVVDDTCTGHGLQGPAATCTLGLVFRPNTAGPARADVEITMSHLCKDKLGICAPPTPGIGQNGNYHRIGVGPVVIIEWTAPMADADHRGTLTVTGTGR